MVGVAEVEEHQEVGEEAHQDEVVAEEALVADLAADGEHLEVVVVRQVVEVRQEVVAVHLEEADEGEPVEEQREVQTPLSSLTDTPVSSSLKEESLYSSLRTWYPEKPSMEKSESVWKVLFKSKRVSQRRRSTEYGTPFDPSWLPVYLEVSTIFTLSLVKRYFTWELQAGLVLATSPTSLDQKASSMQ